MFASCFHGFFRGSPVVSWCLNDLGKHRRDEKYILNTSHKLVHRVRMEAASDDARVKLSVCTGSSREDNVAGIFLATLIRIRNILTRRAVIPADISQHCSKYRAAVAQCVSGVKFIARKMWDRESKPPAAATSGVCVSLLGRQRNIRNGRIPSSRLGFGGTGWKMIFGMQMLPSVEGNCALTPLPGLVFSFSF